MAEHAVAFLPEAADYMSSLPSAALSGDVFAVAAILMAFYLAIFVINQLTGLIIFVLKKLVLLVIVLLAFYQFLITLLAKASAEGLTQGTVMFGVVGFSAGFIALIIAVYAAIASFRDIRLGAEPTPAPAPAAKQPPESGEPEAVMKPPAERSKGQSLSEDFKQVFSVNTLKDDRTLGAILAYLVVAEFGVFSSKTIAAPSALVGLGFFAAFMIAAVLFISQSYSDKRRGMHHFIIAFVVGGMLSLLLGHFWGNYPLEQLFSLGYFATDSLVAFVTGIALSLFMGSRG